MSKSSKRDTLTYKLTGHRGETLYIGTTNNPERREQEHRNEGKNFVNLIPTSRRMTSEGAINKETKQLGTYRQGHKGRNPRYNKDSDG